MKTIIWIFFFLVCEYVCLGDETGGDNGEENLEITIGGFFHGINDQSKVVFDSAIYTANTGVLQYNLPYKSKTEIISEEDSFKCSKIVCSLTEDGISGIFGPASSKTSSIIESMCLNMEIPHIQTSWQPSASPNYHSEDATLINLFPKPQLLFKGMGVIAQHLGWRSYVLLYQNAASFIRLQNVLKLQNFNADLKYNTILVKHLGPGPDYRPVLKDLCNTTEYRFILDCETENILEILTQAAELKLMEPRYDYFLTSLDAHTVDLSTLNTQANITTMRIIHPEDGMFEQIRLNWEQYAIIRHFDVDLSPYSIKTETALMHDAVILFIATVNELHVTQPINPTKMNCYDGQKWSDGLRIAAFMKKKTYSPMGITGPLEFDEFGSRVNFEISIVEGNRDKVIATWTPNKPDVITFMRSETERTDDLIKKIEQRELVVSSRIGAPYLRLRKPEREGQILEGNDRYEGFSMDLIHHLSKVLEPAFTFSYRFEIAKDNAYGSYSAETKSWNGIIRDILDRKADLGICDLTVTHQRREAVDFSLPFLRLGISILHKKAEAKKPSIFAFLDPFSTEIWLYTATLYLIITIILYFVARMSPEDWENPHPCDQNPEELENIWDLKNCFWLTIGSIMNQGCDILPKGISSRMATAAWWFFVIIITNSYTANLAAFLTMEKKEDTINSAEDLAKQTKIKYGTLEGGSTKTFFRDSNYSTYQRMYASMVQAKPSVFEKDNNEGVNRVKNTKHGLYAYLMESTTLEYQLERECDLVQVGNWLDSKGYGIAMPIDFPLRSKINEAILKLQGNGEINRIKEKWWQPEPGEKVCPKDEEDDASAAKLALEKVGGVFLVLGIGIGLAYIVAIMEFLWNVRNVSVDEHLTYWQALKVEVLFALNVWVTRKRVKPNVSDSSSSHSNDNEAHSILHGSGSRLDALNSKNGSSDKRAN